MRLMAFLVISMACALVAFWFGASSGCISASLDLVHGKSVQMEGHGASSKTDYKRHNDTESSTESFNVESQLTPASSHSTVQKSASRTPTLCHSAFLNLSKANLKHRTLCRFAIWEMFSDIRIHDKVTFVGTEKQPVDGLLWHRCVVFGRFQDVDVLEWKNSKQSFPRPKHALIMLRNDGAKAWDYFKTRAQQAAIHMWADERDIIDKSYISEANFSLRHYWNSKVQSSGALYIPNGLWHWEAFNMPPNGQNVRYLNSNPSGKRCNGYKDILRSSHRTHFFNFMGSVGGKLRASRPKMLAELRRQFKVGDTMQSRYLVLVRKSFFDAPTKPFQQAIENSAFTICPCGNNVETHRLWEALFAGSIPVQEDCSSRGLDSHAFLTYLRSSVPDIIFVGDFKKISEILLPYQQDPQLLDKLQERVFFAFYRFMRNIGSHVGDVAIAKWNISSALASSQK